jgi:hypothetical protein
MFYFIIKFLSMNFFPPSFNYLGLYETQFNFIWYNICWIMQCKFHYKCIWWLWFKFTLFSICHNYIINIMLTSIPWSLLFFNTFFFGGKLIQCRWWQWVIFFLSKGATTSPKPIYNGCEQQWGSYLFSFFFEGVRPFVKSNYCC